LLGEKAFGNYIFSKNKFLLESQWWSGRKLTNYQNRRLQLLINHSYKNVPYYRRKFDEYGVNPEKVNTAKELHNLPILTKQDIKENFSDLQATNFKGKYIERKTGGTTGTAPSTFFSSQSSYGWEKAAFFRDWCGYKIGDRVIRYMDPERFKHNRLGTRIRDFLFRHSWLLIKEGDSKEVVSKKIKYIVDINPRFLKGRPSSLSELAELCRDRGIKSITPRSIFTNGENLLLSQRKLFEEVFGCEVFDVYGGEAGIAAFECERHKGYHLSSEIGIIEIIDLYNDHKTVTVHSSLGRIIGTDLTNFKMPMIRYEIQDLARAYNPKEKCRCGRGLPLMMSVEGRYGNLLSTEGKIITEKDVETILLKFPCFQNVNIPRYVQIIQKSENSIEVCILKTFKCANEYCKKIVEDIKKETHEKIEIKVKRVERLVKTPSEKQLFIINEMSL